MPTPSPMRAASVGAMLATLAALIGLGVGIDYALFIVTRHGDGLKDGMAFASVIAVVLTMAAAVTLLPALLGFMGTRVLSRRERRQLAGSGPQDGHGSGFWARLAGFVSRRPGILALSAVVLMLVLASPVLNLRLGLSDAGNDPAASTTRKAYDLLAKGFGPGSNGPLLLVAQIGSPADTAALGRLTQSLRTEPGVAVVVPFPSRLGAKVAVVQVVPSTAPQDVKLSLIHISEPT